MENLKVKIVGEAPLLMHNARLADPLDPIVRLMGPIHKKRKKTDEDHEALARLEFEGGLYFDQAAGPYIPGANIQAMIRDAAKLKRRGTDVSRGLRVLDLVNRLAYEGPRTIQSLWEGKFFNRSPARVGQSTVMRTRPCFTAWSVEFALLIDTETFNLEEVYSFIEDGGRYIGLCDWTPLFGRFRAANGKA